jgi:aminoglycoside/choline kinase family phosphotransferase
MDISIKRIVFDLFRRHYGCDPDHIVPLPPSGSARQYFRIQLGTETVIAAFNPDVRENKAFLWMTAHFRQMGFPVPEVICQDTDIRTYLLSDLGDVTLFSLLPHNQIFREFDPGLIGLYKKTIDWLTLFQIDGARNFDFSLCYPRQSFDRYSMMWDLNYFKYYFLKISGVPFDEQLLEDGFELFISHLLGEKSSYFMYRDFQSRNVMVVDNQPYFIDYQGGRRGPLQYDIASLLFDAKASVPFDLRQQLLDYYMVKAAENLDFDANAFQSYYYDFVLIRVMQALATYGFRGGVEKKPIFLQSMPYALNNIRWLAENGHLPEHNPYLCEIMEKVAARAPGDLTPEIPRGLVVTIRSFSYRQGAPSDHSGNGGGFVFDCRILPNPGRQEQYKRLSGKDKAVGDFLTKEMDYDAFMKSATILCENAVENYLARGFTNLMISFGCTGGQHRSVFCAETMAAHLKQKFPVSIDLQHMEEKNWPANES